MTNKSLASVTLQNLISEIQPFLEEAFEKQVFQASVMYLSNNDDFLRFSCFAYSLRELIRIFLSRTSPEEYILACQWYKPETDNGKPSRRQRFRYYTQGGLSDEFISNTLNIDINDAWTPFKISINNLSKHTHINESTFMLKENEKDELAVEILETFITALTHAHDVKQEILLSIEDHVNEEVFNQTILNTMTDIDELSTHGYAESAMVEDLEVIKIDCKKIYFEGSGYVDVTLNWGGGEDSVSMDTSFPFSFTGYSDVNTPLTPNISHYDITIDISSWYK